MPEQTCFSLPVDPTVTHMEGLDAGTESVGSINPFIVALISQLQSIRLFELAEDQELLVWKSEKSISTRWMY